MILATVPIRCMSMGAGSATSAARCMRMPICRSSRTACCAAAIERPRPMVIGNTRPGNKTRLRTGTIIRASGGNGAMDAAARFPLSSDLPRNWASVTQLSRFFQRKHETSVAYGVAHRAIAPRRKPHAALESPLGQLETMDDSGAQFRGKDPHAGDQEVISVENSLHTFRLDARQGDQHEHFTFGFQHIERRLPGR